MTLKFQYLQMIGLKLNIINFQPLEVVDAVARHNLKWLKI